MVADNWCCGPAAGVDDGCVIEGESFAMAELKGFSVPLKSREENVDACS